MRILKRMLDFIASRMLMVTVACALLIISFYLAMNTANIWVLIDDGLDARASVVLMGEDAGKLTSYFRPEFIAQDPVLQVGMSDTSPYRDYEIRGYDHRVKMVSVWSWPWENVARAEVVESIPAIDGTIRSAKREAALAASSGRVLLFDDLSLAAAGFRGETWDAQCLRIVETLPQEVYVSFDIDGLSYENCPHTGTPVAGGLGFNQAVWLLDTLVRSGRRIVGFDVVEVTPAREERIDAITGARVLWKLCNLTLKSNVR